MLDNFLEFIYVNVSRLKKEFDYHFYFQGDNSKDLVNDRLLPIEWQKKQNYLRKFHIERHFSSQKENSCLIKYTFMMCSIW